MPDSFSEDFRTDPNASAGFGNVPQNAETFRTVQNSLERRSDHTLTVREVARMFEAAGVARTERSITNWCQPNKTGIARLDAYFDPNERKYFITPESVETAIQEELGREKIKAGEVARSTDHSSKDRPNSPPGAEAPGNNKVTALEQEILDLKIMNRGKDYFIGELRKEREAFGEERQRYVEELMRSNRRLGELETKLNQIEAPADSSVDDR
jgi:hypothetical protein